jgi:hypothetical protein
MDFRIARWVLIFCLAGPAVHALELEASDNAFVYKGAATTDQDESQSLRVKSDGADPNTRLAYLRFDVSGVATNAGDSVFLDINLTTVASDAVRLDVWSLNDAVATETTWGSGLTYNTRPDGTGNVPNGNTGGTAIGVHGYVGTGQISIPISNATFMSLMAGDTNDELTFILANDTDANDVSFVSSLDNTGGNPTPTLRVLSVNKVETIVESGYGGSLREVSESSFTYAQSGSQAKVGEGGTGNDTEYIQILMFELPVRPPDGFRPEDTSLTLTIASEDVETTGEHADLWAVGYVPAENIGDVGANLNNGGVTDIDDFFLSEADTETKVGWNIGADNTEKLWDDLVSQFSLSSVASPPAANSNLTAFVNDLYLNHGAAAGDYLVLRVNYDVDMTNYDDWTFYTGDEASDSLKPRLTLSAVENSGLMFIVR